MYLRLCRNVLVRGDKQHSVNFKFLIPNHYVRHSMSNIIWDFLCATKKELLGSFFGGATRIWLSAQKLLRHFKASQVGRQL